MDSFTVTPLSSQGICRLGLGKDEYKFGDLTKATVRKVTGSNGYNFGDLTKGGHEARHRQG